jgi:hypothetical protein
MMLDHSAPSREYLEPLRMSGTNDAEVPAIECADLNDAQSLGGCHDRRIDCSESEVRILRNEFGDPDPILGMDGFRDQVPRCEITEESNLSLRTKARFQQISDFDNHKLGTINGPGWPPSRSRLD